MTYLLPSVTPFGGILRIWSRKSSCSLVSVICKLLQEWIRPCSSAHLCIGSGIIGYMDRGNCPLRFFFGLFFPNFTILTDEVLSGNDWFVSPWLGADILSSQHKLTEHEVHCDLWTPLKINPIKYSFHSKQFKSFWYSFDIRSHKIAFSWQDGSVMDTKWLTRLLHSLVLSHAIKLVFVQDKYDSQLFWELNGVWKCDGMGKGGCKWGLLIRRSEINPSQICIYLLTTDKKGSKDEMWVLIATSRLLK